MAKNVRKYHEEKALWLLQDVKIVPVTLLANGLIPKYLSEALDVAYKHHL
jgi:hypothetical protein